ncbi:uncharacterized protein ana2 [Eurosta solidaginis]|uniref:uncharacterized protein ana2 n=1 Tax=Eurosta solidaginis TaxID=178769 RepID=UPI0035307CC1
MFQLETEDMLPRSAPKPSVPLDLNTAAIVRPTVPEVSILFGAQQAETANSLPTTTAHQPNQQTYAAWKKQVLPKVTFPPAGSEVYSINGHVVSAASVTSEPSTTSSNEPTAIGNTQATTNLYPLRPVTASVSPQPSYVHSNANTYVSCQPTTHLQEYRRSIGQALYIQPNTQENIQRRTITHEYAQAPTSDRDVLTICAGTQTDPTLLIDSPTKINSTHLANMATKEELQRVLVLLGEMRMEQMRLIETLLAQQQSNTAQRTVSYHDVSTQYATADYCIYHEKQNQFPQVDYEGMEGYNRMPTAHDRYQPIKEMNAYILDSPQQPAAQSTAYHPLAPRATNAPTKSNLMVVHNKANTEKSMLMNELAMKYLPNEQLNELLHELNIVPAVTQRPSTPLRPIENIERRPSDISNASYKYLKKYRLLPEEHDKAKEELTPSNSPLAQIATQQPHQLDKSPYQHKATPPQKPHMVDLENIRRQPKLI